MDELPDYDVWTAMEDGDCMEEEATFLGVSSFEVEQSRRVRTRRRTLRSKMIIATGLGTLFVVMVFVLLITLSRGGREGESDTPPPSLPLTSTLREPRLSIDNVTECANRMAKIVQFLASDKREGRLACTQGHDDARSFINAKMKEIGLTPLIQHNPPDYLLPPFSSPKLSESQAGAFYRTDPDGGDRLINSPCNRTVMQNVAGLLGTSSSSEKKPIVLICAHYDHLGSDAQGNIYNGAFDDAGGVAVVLEVAKQLLDGESMLGFEVLFLITDGEEIGTRGIRDFLSSSSSIALDDIAFTISIDPAGRKLLESTSLLLLVGSEQFPSFHQFLRDAAVTVEQQPPDGIETLVALLNRRAIGKTFGNDGDRVGEAGIPAVWFINPGMSFYHTIEDESNTLDYDSIMPDNVKIILDILHASTRYDIASFRDSRVEKEGESLTTADLADFLPVVNKILKAPELNREDREMFQHIRSQLMNPEGIAGLQPDEDSFFLNAVLKVLELSQKYPERSNTAVENAGRSSVEEVERNETAVDTQLCPSFFAVALSGCVNIANILAMDGALQPAETFRQLMQSSCSGSMASTCRPLLQNIVNHVINPKGCSCADVLCTAAYPFVHDEISTWEVPQVAVQCN